MGAAQTFEFTLLVLTAIRTVHGFDVLEQTMSFRAGRTRELPCRVPPGTQIEMIQWRKGDNILSIGPDATNEKFKIIQHPNEMNLEIKDIHRNDAGLYTCISIDEQVFARITVLVKWKPEIFEKESSRKQEHMIEGSTGQLQCVVSGEPQPNITWHRRAQRDRQFKPIGVSGEKLTIYNITRYGSDVYMCNASNTQGYATWEMNVTVHFPVEVSILESDMELVKRDKIAITCAVQGSPVVDYHWKFNDEKIPVRGDWKYGIVPDHEDGYPFYFLTLVSRKDKLDKGYFGNYTCHAEGSDSVSDHSITLTQKKDVDDQ